MDINVTDAIEIEDYSLKIPYTYELHAVGNYTYVRSYIMANDMHEEYNIRL